MFHNPQLVARDFVLACIPTLPAGVPMGAGEHPARATAVAMVQCLEETIENLIDLLDELHGEPDLEPGADDEPCLGWTMAGALGALDDREKDDGGESGIADHDGMAEQFGLGGKWGERFA